MNSLYERACEARTRAHSSLSIFIIHGQGVPPLSPAIVRPRAKAILNDDSI